MLYEIGDFIEDYDLDIVDKKIFRDKYGHTKSMYKYSCRKCGFDCGEHYVKGNKKQDNWVNKIKGCGCCNSFICVSGINDISTTDPWMIQYFVNKEEAQMFKSGSNEKVQMKCIYCGKYKMYKINDLYQRKGMTCDCYDKMSFPNKFAYYTFMQLIDDIDYYEREYSPDWSGRYRYDNYFEYQGEKYIVEMDGELGHGKKTFGTGNKKDEEGLLRDIIKTKLANDHNITVIRVSAEKSEYKHIKNNLSNTLKCIIDTSKIDWDNVYEQCCSNEIKKYAIIILII